jgi:hypothetical protein
LRKLFTKERFNQNLSDWRAMALMGKCRAGLESMPSAM